MTDDELINAAALRIAELLEAHTGETHFDDVDLMAMQANVEKIGENPWLLAQGFTLVIHELLSRLERAGSDPKMVLFELCLKLRRESSG